MKTEKNQQPSFGFINHTQKQEKRMKQGERQGDGNLMKQGNDHLKREGRPFETRGRPFEFHFQ